MIVLRSLVFNTVFYLNLFGRMLFGLHYLWGPRITAIRALQRWATSSLWLLDVICNIKMEVRGREHLPRGAALVAGKHHSFWETFAVLPLLDDPCFVMKAQLFKIPLFGHFGKKFEMIGVDREAGSASVRKLMSDARNQIAKGRQIIIMPEGTRRAPGDPPAYRSGAAALYKQLDVACIPFGLNAGLFWPRRKFLRYPGTIVIEFCPPIPPGLTRQEFQMRLENAIETSTQCLLAEAKAALVQK